MIVVVYRLMNCSLHKTMKRGRVEAWHVDARQEPTLSLQLNLKWDFDSFVGHAQMTFGGKGGVDSISLSERHTTRRANKLS